MRNMNNLFKEIISLINQFEDISLKFSEPLDENEMNELLSKQGKAKAEPIAPAPIITIFDI